MVRGCEKRIVRLKNPEGGLFEEVLFVLRDEGELSRRQDRDIVAEATRLLEENMLRRKERKGRRPHGALPFLLGVAATAVVLIPFLIS